MDVHTQTQENFSILKVKDLYVNNSTNKKKVKKAKTAVCHISLLRPAGLTPANQKPCPNVDTESEAVLLPVVLTFRNFQEEPCSTSPNPKFLKCFNLCHFGLAVAQSHLNPHAVVQAWLPQAGTQPGQEAF